MNCWELAREQPVDSGAEDVQLAVRGRLRGVGEKRELYLHNDNFSAATATLCAGGSNRRAGLCA